MSKATLLLSSAAVAPIFTFLLMEQAIHNEQVTPYNPCLSLFVDTVLSLQVSLGSLLFVSSNILYTTLSLVLSPQQFYPLSSPDRVDSHTSQGG